MLGTILALTVLLAAQAPLHHHAHYPRVRPAPEKSASAEMPVSRIDSLIATERRGRISVQARGAVMGGGWRHPALKVTKTGQPGDAHVLVLDFVAVPPGPAEAVIPGLLPVTASISVRARRGVVSVRAVSNSNDITTQILRAGSK